MTNTPISEREKALLEAVRKYFAYNSIGITHPAAVGQEDLLPILDALRAYDPKPEPVPVIPAWEEFIIGKNYVDIGMVKLRPSALISREDYEAIREATSRPKAPTE